MERFLEELWMILVESSLWLLVGFAIAGAVHALIPRQWMLKHLSGGGIWPIAKASMLGIPLPLCSCSVIPVAAGLRKQGASKGASAAFAISTPQTGEESIPITWALFGPVYALTRPVVAVITGLIAGLLIDATGKKDQDDLSDGVEDPSVIGLSIMNADDADTAVKSCCSSIAPEAVKSCCAEEPTANESSCCASESEQTHTSVGEKIRIGFKHGFGTMVIDLVVWLTIGLLLAALISTLLPREWIASNFGEGIVPMLAMLLVGIPLYICATSSTPLAWSLVAAGMSPGAALVMLLSGPATNVATMSWLIKDLGVRALVIYLATIASTALAAGLLFDAFLQRFVIIADLNQEHEMHAHGFGVKEIAAVLFVMLMAWALGMKARAWMNAKGFGTTEMMPAGGGCCSNAPKANDEKACGCSKG